MGLHRGQRGGDSHSDHGDSDLAHRDEHARAHRSIDRGGDRSPIRSSELSKYRDDHGYYTDYGVAVAIRELRGLKPGHQLCRRRNRV